MTGALIGSVADSSDRRAGAAIGFGAGVVLALIGWFVGNEEREEKHTSGDDHGTLGTTHVTPPATQPTSQPASLP